MKVSHQMDTVLPLQAGSVVKPVASGEDSPIACFSQQVEDISQELMGYIADKWTLVVLEELHDHGVMRFNELRKAVPGISQKMLTQTLRQMERNGLVSRKVHAVIPPKVEYQRTELGHSLGPVICGLWTWVEQNSTGLVAARAEFDGQAARVAEQMP
jgi:DNA-binding HxlR family transcriptional regulator